MKNAEEVFLATAPDREGEAIAWHLQDALKLKNAKRLTYAEITEAAIRAALSNPRSIDMGLVPHRKGGGCWIAFAVIWFPGRSPTPRAKNCPLAGCKARPRLPIPSRPKPGTKATALTGTLTTKKTKPAARFTEASLIRELEKRGIGRPSTYAAIIDSISSRKYVTTEKRFLVPAPRGKDCLRPLRAFFVH